MAFLDLAEGILEEFSSAQGRGERFDTIEERDWKRRDHRKRAMAPVYELRARTKAKMANKAWLGPQPEPAHRCECGQAYGSAYGLRAHRVRSHKA